MARDGKELRCASRDDRCEVAVYVVECLITSMRRPVHAVPGLAGRGASALDIVWNYAAEGAFRFQGDICGGWEGL